MHRIGDQEFRKLMNTRKLRSELDAIALELDKVPDQAEPQEWSEEQPSSDLEAELLKCKQLRQELRSLKRQRR